MEPRYPALQLDAAQDTYPRDAGATTGEAGRNARVRLTDLLAALPPEATLPVWWIRRVSEGDQAIDLPILASRSCDRHPDEGPPAGLRSTGTGPEPLLMTPREFGARHRPARSEHWVREQCRHGAVPGAYKEGGEWMIPESALAVRSPGRASPRQVAPVGSPTHSTTAPPSVVARKGSSRRKVGVGGHPLSRRSAG